MIRAAKQHEIGLTVVGLEAPLCAGIVDRLQAAEMAGQFKPGLVVATITNPKPRITMAIIISISENAFKIRQA